MNKDEFFPVRKKHTTNTAFGRPSKNPAVKTGMILSMPITRLDGVINSVWKIESIWARLKILFKGEITIRILAEKQPPIAVIAGDIFS